MTNLEYKIVLYEKKYFPQLVRLLSLTFSMKSPNKGEIINWKFFDQSLQGRTIMYLALFHNQVVGQYSSIPVNLTFKGNDFPSGICVDMATHPDHRGKGLIHLMSEPVYKELSKRSSISIGFSNTTGVKVDRHSNKYGYNIVGPFKTYGKIVLLHKKTPYSLVEIHEIKQEVTSNNAFLMIKKSKEYLTWKHINNPFYKKYVYEIHNADTFKGYVILRIKKQRLYIQDIIVEDYSSQNIGNVIKAVENLALTLHKKFVMMIVLDNDYWSSLLSKNRFIKNYLNKKKYYLTTKIFDSKLNFAKDRNNWFIMGGDIV